MSSRAREFLTLAFQGWFTPRSHLTPWEWHEHHKTLLGSSESQDYAGEYDSSLAPHARIVMEFVGGRFSENIEFHPDTPADATWREMIVMKSSQVGITLAVLLSIVWWIAEVRKNVIYAIDTTTEAKRISKARLQPLIRSCPPAASRVDEDEDSMSNLTLYLLGLVVYILGGASEAAFQNKVAALGVLDEADYHPQPTPGKPNNLDDLRSRMKTVTDGKILSVSKPKTESHLTYKEHKTGTQHVCRVPCPHCGHYQELIWENVRFEHCKDLAGSYDLERIRKETVYECEACHGRIEESHKRQMMLAHRWVQTNPKPKPGKLSIHISDLYSQFPTSTWGELAVEYVEALKSVSAMTTFRIDRLGKPARIQSNERKPEDVRKLRCITPQYNRGTVPFDPLLTVMSADVQGDVRKFGIGAFNRKGELWLVNWGYTLSFDELLEIADERIPIGMPYCDPRVRSERIAAWDGPTAMVGQGIIDEGHIHLEVRRFCLRSNGLFVPSKGRAGIQVRHTVHESTAECDGSEMIVYHFDDDAFKKQLYVDRITNLPKILSGKSRTPRMFAPWDMDEEFVDELCSEKLTHSTDRMGFTREEWEKDPAVPNDFGDVVKQMLVVWYWLSPSILAALPPETPAAEPAAA